MGYWARTATDRDQLMLIPVTLSDRIPEDHVVRLFWELLESYDWSCWEQHYCGCHGQPAIHPRVMAGVLLYGLTQGIRSSRRLEWACGHAVDYMWLAEGRVIDHSTFCDFRRRFGRELKDLFRHLGRLAKALGVVRLNCVTLDGTRVAANANRFEKLSAAEVEAELSRLDEQLTVMLEEAEAADRQERWLGNQGASSVPPKLASTQARRDQLAKALQRIRKHSGKVSPTDPDAPILPNKDGGYRPNFTPVLAVDEANRFIVAETVQAQEQESTALIPLLDETQATFEAAPTTMLADSHYCTEDNLQALQDRPTDAYIAPANERLAGPKQTPTSRPNVAHRDNPRESVAKECWPQLPRTRSGRIAKEAFIYDREHDCYWCPMGRAARLQRIDQDRVDGEMHARRVYYCTTCDGCPLRSQCAERNGFRRVRSRGQEPLREHMTQKVHSPAGRAIYRRRQTVAESPFGFIKSAMGVRQFLVRGLEAVRTEWRWVCTAYDLRVLVRWLQTHRVRLA